MAWVTNMNAKNEDRSNRGAFLCGLLTGITVGAGLAMLYAPKRGSEVRRDLADGASDLGQAARDTWQDVTTTASAAVQKGREAYEQTRAAVQGVADSTSQSVDRAKQAVADAANDLAPGGSFPRPAGGGKGY